jgi:formylglycine-generating enzyme required for sulfatase activity
VELADKEKKHIIPLIVRRTSPSGGLRLFTSAHQQIAWTHASEVAAAVARVFPPTGPTPESSSVADAGRQRQAAAARKAEDEKQAAARKRKQQAEVTREAQKRQRVTRQALWARMTLFLRTIKVKELVFLVSLLAVVIGGPLFIAHLSASPAPEGATLPASAASAESSSERSTADTGTAPMISGRRPLETFRDCEDVCPEMVWIKPGSFMMGSPDTEKGHQADEGPVHEVRIAYSFAVGKYPVTRGEWRLYANDTGHRTTEGCRRSDAKKDWLNPGFPQDDKHPVVCVSWQEAQDYIAWLNKKSGQHFRLLTEAEYEYVNRAGQQTAYSWGDSDAEVARHASSNGKGTTPVGSFPANAMGLFDTTGNVWSWTQDCWHKRYTGVPTDGSAWDTGCGSSAHVLRGGSWATVTWSLRSASRFGSGGGYDFIGARVARDDRPSNP